MLKRLFTQHPRSVGESYGEHFGVAGSFGLRLTVAGLACFVHALLPFLCVKTGSNAIRALHHDMVTHRQRKATGPVEAGVYLGDAI
jgi:hypothetical protein